MQKEKKSTNIFIFLKIHKNLQNFLLFFVFSLQTNISFRCVFLYFGGLHTHTHTQNVTAQNHTKAKGKICVWKLSVWFVLSCFNIKGRKKANLYKKKNVEFLKHLDLLEKKSLNKESSQQLFHACFF